MVLDKNFIQNQIEEEEKISSSLKLKKPKDLID